MRAVFRSIGATGEMSEAAAQTAGAGGGFAGYFWPRTPNTLAGTESVAANVLIAASRLSREVERLRLGFPASSPVSGPPE
jgi:hypothetical protein